MQTLETYSVGVLRIPFLKTKTFMLHGEWKKSENKISNLSRNKNQNNLFILQLNDPDKNYNTDK